MSAPLLPVRVPSRPHSNEEDFNASVNVAYKDFSLLEWVRSFFGARWGRQVSRPKATLTEGVTLFLTVGFFVYEVLYRKIVLWFITFATHVNDLKLIEIVKFSNDVTQLTLYLLLCMMFVTLCYKCDFIHEKVWKRKTWFLPNMMAGGFAPRLIAFSLGCLIFASGTFFKVEKVSGSKLLDWNLSKWDVCRAISLEMPNRTSHWLSRIHRFPPAQRGWTCIGVDQFDMLGYIFEAHSFSEDFIHNLELQHGHDIPGLIHPEHNIERILPAGALPAYIVSLFHWFNPVDIEDKMCMYECFKWKEVSFLSFIKDIGTIATGCSIVAKGTEYLTEQFGSSCVLRMGLVTPCTTPDQFKKIFTSSRFGSFKRHTRHMDSNRKPRCWEQSHFLCAVVLTIMILVIPHIFAPDLDMDGYYTQDFYVTEAFLASFLISLLVRIGSPFLCEPIFYTKKMWTNGSDMFIKICESGDTIVQMQPINLYEWIHLSYKQRCLHLYKYARSVSASECVRDLPVRALDDFAYVDWKVQSSAESVRYVIKVQAKAEGVVVKMTDQGKAMVRWSHGATCEPRDLLSDQDLLAETGLENLTECSNEWREVGRALGLEQAEV